MKPSVVVFGSDSLVGSDFVAKASADLEIHAVGRSDPRALGLDVAQFDRLDLSDEKALRKHLSQRSGDLAWVNFAARTDVDGCEAERPNDPELPESSVSRRDSAWTMNAELPHWVADESHRSETPYIHLSTDFVFDGATGPNAEDDRPSPFGPKVSWYGYTKGVGEGRVRSGRGRASILRISYPFRAVFRPKSDFARNLLERARSGGLYPLYSDQRITPTWIPDATEAVIALLRNPAAGVVHVASPESTSPLEFARVLFHSFGLDAGSLAESRLADQPNPPGRAPRPLRGGLAVQKAGELGVAPLDFREAIRRMAAQQTGW